MSTKRNARAQLRTNSATALFLALLTSGCCGNACKLRQCTFPKTVLDVRTQIRTAASAKDALNEAFPEREVPDEGRVVYGLDNRKDASEVADELRRLTRSTAIFTFRKAPNAHQPSITRDGEGWKLVPKKRQRKGKPPCSKERFARQVRGGYCTAFLIAGDVVATAGHCLRATALGNMALVFGYQHGADGEPPPTRFDQNQVYSVGSVIAFEYRGSMGADYALIRLDRPVPAEVADPLELRMDELIKGDNLNVIGYPSGLPAKVAFGDSAVIRETTKEKYWGNLDTYGGNSGSPVFDRDGKVVGILVTGTSDYLYRKDCFESVQLNDSVGAGNARMPLFRRWEGVAKISQFEQHLPACVVVD